MESARAGKLAKLFKDTLSGRLRVHPGNANLFLEAIRSQTDPGDCLYQLTSSNSGMDALQNAMRFNLAVSFLNEHASPLLHYLQQPELAEIGGGQLLQSALLKIADPPIFWNPFQQAFLNDTLTLDGQKAFGWLLLQLVSLPPSSSASYREDSNFNKHLSLLMSSDDIKLRTLGQKIKHATEELKSDPSTFVTSAAGSTPGGRHDNDFADFRQIAIVPTPDEAQCKEPAFIRPSDFLRDSSTETTRVATHLDNQFRLLREDMLYELRDELQLALGSQKRRRGTKITGLQVVDLYLRESRPRGKNIHWVKCGLQLECGEDLSIFQGVNLKRREKHIEDAKHFLRHQSLACLQSENEIIAFVTINRDTALLANPKPIIAVQLEGNEGILKTLQKIKKSDNLTLIQIDTALFAYEFVLRALQETPSLPLSEELLLWKPGGVPQEIEIHKQATPVVNALRLNPYCDLKTLLQTKDHIQLDTSQSKSLLLGLVQRVSLIQGPPGTGKSFIGALMAKAIHDYTKQTILVICFTNHALDDILTSLLEIGIPDSSMVRLGGKSTPKTEPLTLQRQRNTGSRGDKSAWQAIREAESMLGALEGKLTSKFADYMDRAITPNDILDHLGSNDSDYFSAFTVPEGEDGMEIVGDDGQPIRRTYLLQRWLKGNNAGIFKSSRNVQVKSAIWNMNLTKRKRKSQEWYDTLEKGRVRDLYATIQSFNKWSDDLTQAFEAKDISLIRGKRIIGCTTSAAAKYRFSIQAAAPDVVLVEEAGEILESHILTALGSGLSQLILIGDHKQLRPKVKNYELTVEKNSGYDLNCSLFERLILSGYPHQTLKKQHRMRPEISDLIRQLTYPELRDASRTQNRPNITGVQDNIVFISHTYAEGNHGQLADAKDMASKTSKQNQFEVGMVLKIVKYLGQQGYGTDDLVVLTPYLGQLHCLREALKTDNDPLLSDLDSYELVKAGLLSPITAKLNKKPIRLSTIDNYQGEESDIVIISLTRSNNKNDIGFMYSPERLNVLLSRARNGLIMIGNSSTFKNSRKGKELWTKLFNMLTEGKHIYDGLPVYCARHPDRKEILCTAKDFDEKCPDGGCIQPCNTMLNCQLHRCSATCHNIADHSKVLCAEVVSERCPRGHTSTRKCHELSIPGACRACQREAKLAIQKQQEELKEKERKEAAERKHLQEMAGIKAEIEKEQRRQREAKEEEERAQALLQRRAHLLQLKQAELEEKERKEAAQRKQLQEMAKLRAAVEEEQRRKREAEEAAQRRQLQEMAKIKTAIEEEQRRKREAEEAAQCKQLEAMAKFTAAIEEERRRKREAEEAAQRKHSQDMARRNAEIAKERQEREAKVAAQRKHWEELAAIDAEIEMERRQKKKAKEVEERALAVLQRRADFLRARTDIPFGSMSTPRNVSEPPPSGILGTLKYFASAVYSNISPQVVQPMPSGRKLSPAESEWQQQRSAGRAFSAPIDKIMAMVGLESVKYEILAIKAKIDMRKQQNSSLAKEQFNISFLGNPGTGKCIVARHYSAFLFSVGVIPGTEFVETTGSRLGYEGVQGVEKMLQGVLRAGGGTIFIDEVYQLTNGNNSSGAQVLDFLLAQMKYTVGKIVFIVAGYCEEMETFFEYYPVLQSRIPYKVKFNDYSDEELMDMFENLVVSTYKSQMQVEDGYQGLYARVAIRRLGRRRGAPGFGNARDLRIFFAKVRERQAMRLYEEQRDGKRSDAFLLTKEDLIGPDPSIAIKKSKAWEKLQSMIGLKSVKKSVKIIVNSIQENYRRELNELEPLEWSLHRVFLGPPGTGKTTVAGLYGQILADLGLLSNGEVVVRNPGDFVGATRQESEKKTKGILSNSIGKVLVIDKANMLYGGGGVDAKNQSNESKSSVIDTIVAETRNSFGDDRCVLLLGGEEEMTEMFANVNPGLVHRFKVRKGFKFESFTDDELFKILELKLKDRDLGATDLAKKVAIAHLSQLRIRPNFGNGAEVENLLSRAEEQCVQRRSKLPLSRKPRNMILEPQDFLDEDSDRATIANIAQQKSDPQMGSSDPPRSAIPVLPIPASSSRSIAPALSLKTRRSTSARDPGVSDEVWMELKAARRQAEEEDRQKREELSVLSRGLQKAKQEVEAQRKRAEELARQGAQDEAQRKQLEGQRRQAEEIERRLRSERERIADLDRRSRIVEYERMRKEEAIQEKLRQSGICTQGFQWIRTGSGYRCAGGSHFVSSEQLGM